MVVGEGAGCLVLICDTLMCCAVSVSVIAILGRSGFLVLVASFILCAGETDVCCTRRALSVNGALFPSTPEYTVKVVSGADTFVAFIL